MRPFLTAMLFWYEEPEDQLFDAVRSLGKVCDAVVAADGAFALYPDGTPTSPVDESVAIMDAASLEGMDAIVSRPRALWPGEVAKRQHLLDIAIAIGSEWVFMFYADQEVVEGERWKLKAQLAGHVAAAPEVFILEGHNEPTNPWETAGESSRERLMFKVVPGMHYGRHHSHLIGVVDGRKRALWGHPGYPTIEHVDVDVRLEHANTRRPKARNERQLAYYAARDEDMATRGYEP